MTIAGCTSDLKKFLAINLVGALILSAPGSTGWANASSSTQGSPKSSKSSGSSIIPTLTQAVETAMAIGSAFSQSSNGQVQVGYAPIMDGYNPDGMAGSLPAYVADFMAGQLSQTARVLANPNDQSIFDSVLASNKLDTVILGSDGGLISPDATMQDYYAVQNQQPIRDQLVKIDQQLVQATDEGIGEGAVLHQTADMNAFAETQATIAQQTEQVNKYVTNLNTLVDQAIAACNGGGRGTRSLASACQQDISTAEKASKMADDAQAKLQAMENNVNQLKQTDLQHRQEVLDLANSATPSAKKFINDLQKDVDCLKDPQCSPYDAYQAQLQPFSSQSQSTIADLEQKINLLKSGVTPVPSGDAMARLKGLGTLSWGLVKGWGALMVGSYVGLLEGAVLGGVSGALIGLPFAAVGAGPGAALGVVLGGVSGGITGLWDIGGPLAKKLGATNDIENGWHQLWDGAAWGQDQQNMAQASDNSQKALGNMIAAYNLEAVEKGLTQSAAINASKEFSFGSAFRNDSLLRSAADHSGQENRDELDSQAEHILNNIRGILPDEQKIDRMAGGGAIGENPQTIVDRISAAFGNSKGIYDNAQSNPIIQLNKWSENWNRQVALQYGLLTPAQVAQYNATGHSVMEDPAMQDFFKNFMGAQQDLASASQSFQEAQNSYQQLLQGTPGNPITWPINQVMGIVSGTVGLAKAAFGGALNNRGLTPNAWGTQLEEHGLYDYYSSPLNGIAKGLAWLFSGGTLSNTTPAAQVATQMDISSDAAFDAHGWQSPDGGSLPSSPLLGPMTDRAQKLYAQEMNSPEGQAAVWLGETPGPITVEQVLGPGAATLRLSPGQIGGMGGVSDWTNDYVNAAPTTGSAWWRAAFTTLPNEAVNTFAVMASFGAVTEALGFNDALAASARGAYVDPVLYGAARYNQFAGYFIQWNFVNGIDNSLNKIFSNNCTGGCVANETANIAGIIFGMGSSKYVGQLSAYSDQQDVLNDPKQAAQAALITVPLAKPNFGTAMLQETAGLGMQVGLSMFGGAAAGGLGWYGGALTGTTLSQAFTANANDQNSQINAVTKNSQNDPYLRAGQVVALQTLFNGMSDQELAAADQKGSIDLAPKGLNGILSEGILNRVWSDTSLTNGSTVSLADGTAGREALDNVIADRSRTAQSPYGADDVVAPLREALRNPSAASGEFSSAQGANGGEESTGGGGTAVAVEVPPESSRQSQTVSPSVDPGALFTDPSRTLQTLQQRTNQAYADLQSTDPSSPDYNAKLKAYQSAAKEEESATNTLAGNPVLAHMASGGGSGVVYHFAVGAHLINLQKSDINTALSGLGPRMQDLQLQNDVVDATVKYQNEVKKANGQETLAVKQAEVNMLQAQAGLDAVRSGSDSQAALKASKALYSAQEDLSLTQASDAESQGTDAGKLESNKLKADASYYGARAKLAEAKLSGDQGQIDSAQKDAASAQVDQAQAAKAVAQAANDAAAKEVSDLSGTNDNVALQSARATQAQTANQLNLASANADAAVAREKLLTNPNDTGAQSDLATALQKAANAQVVLAQPLQRQQGALNTAASTQQQLNNIGDIRGIAQNGAYATPQDAASAEILANQAQAKRNGQTLYATDAARDAAIAQRATEITQLRAGSEGSSSVAPEKTVEKINTQLDTISSKLQADLTQSLAEANVAALEVAKANADLANTGFISGLSDGIKQAAAYMMSLGQDIGIVSTPPDINPLGLDSPDTIIAADPTTMGEHPDFSVKDYIDLLRGRETLRDAEQNSYRVAADLNLGEIRKANNELDGQIKEAEKTKGNRLDSEIKIKVNGVEVTLESAKKLAEVQQLVLKTGEAALKNADSGTVRDMERLKQVKNYVDLIKAQDGLRDDGLEGNYKRMLQNEAKAAALSRKGEVDQQNELRSQVTEEITKFKKEVVKLYGEKYKDAVKNLDSDWYKDADQRAQVLRALFGKSENLTETEALAYTELIMRDKGIGGIEKGFKTDQIRMIIQNLHGNIGTLAMGGGKTFVYGADFGVLALKGEDVQGHLIVSNSDQITKFVGKSDNQSYLRMMQASGLEVHDGHALYEQGKNDGQAPLKSVLSTSAIKVVAFDISDYGHLTRESKENPGLGALMRNRTAIGVDEADVGALLQQSFNVGSPKDATMPLKSDVMGLHQLFAANDVHFEPETSLFSAMQDDPSYFAYTLDSSGQIQASRAVYDLVADKTAPGSGDYYTAGQVREALRGIQEIADTANEKVVYDPITGELHKSGLDSSFQHGTKDQSDFYTISAIVAAETRAATKGDVLDTLTSDQQASILQKKMALTTHGSEATISEAFTQRGGQKILVFGGSGTFEGAEAIGAAVYGVGHVVAIQDVPFSDFAYKAHILTKDANGQQWVQEYNRQTGKFESDPVKLEDFLAQRASEAADKGRGYLGVYADLDSLKSGIKGYILDQLNSNSPESAQGGISEARSELERIFSATENSQRIGVMELSDKNAPMETSLMDALKDADSPLLRQIVGRIEVIDPFTQSELLEGIAEKTSSEQKVVFAVERAGRALDFKGENELGITNAEKYAQGDLLQTLGRTGRTSSDGTRADTERDVFVDLNNLATNAVRFGRMNEWLQSQKTGYDSLKSDFAQIDERFGSEGFAAFAERAAADPTAITQSELKSLLETNSLFKLYEKRDGATRFRLSSEVVTKLAKEPLGFEQSIAVGTPNAGTLAKAYDKLRQSGYDNSRSTYRLGDFRSPEQIAKDSLRSGLEQSAAMWEDVAKNSQGSLAARAAARALDIRTSLATLDTVFDQPVLPGEGNSFSSIDPTKDPIARLSQGESLSGEVIQVSKSLSKDLLPSESSVSSVPDKVAVVTLRNVTDQMRAAGPEAPSDGEIMYAARMAQKAYALNQNLARSDPFLAKLAAVPINKPGSADVLRTLISGYVGNRILSTANTLTGNGLHVLPSSWRAAMNGMAISFNQSRAMGYGILKSVVNTIRYGFIPDLTQEQQGFLAAQLLASNAADQRNYSILRLNQQAHPDVFLSQMTSERITRIADQASTKGKTQQAATEIQKQVIKDLSQVRMAARIETLKNSDLVAVEAGETQGSPVTLTITRESPKEVAPLVAEFAQLASAAQTQVTVRVSKSIAQDTGAAPFVTELKNLAVASNLKFDSATPHPVASSISLSEQPSAQPAVALVNAKPASVSPSVVANFFNPAHAKALSIYAGFSIVGAAALMFLGVTPLGLAIVGSAVVLGGAYWYNAASLPEVSPRQVQVTLPTEATMPAIEKPYVDPQLLAIPVVKEGPVRGAEQQIPLSLLASVVRNPGVRRFAQMASGVMVLMFVGQTALKAAELHATITTLIGSSIGPEGWVAITIGAVAVLLGGLILRQHVKKAPNPAFSTTA